jgi:TonB family protein
MGRLTSVLALVLLTAGSALAQQPVRVGGPVSPPKKTKDVRAVYPPIAQSARVQGVVILEVTIGIDGRVQDAKVLRSIPMLDAAALDAVKQWEFTPTMLNGAPVPVMMTVTVNFTLQDELTARSCGDEPSMRSPDGTAAATINFVNQADAPRKLYWLDASGVRHWYQTIDAGAKTAQPTTVGQTWVIADAQDMCLAIFVATAGAPHATIARLPR